MTDQPTVPAAGQLEQAVSLFQQFRADLAEDRAMPGDESALLALVTAIETDPHQLLDKLIDAATWTQARADEADALRRAITARRDRYRNRLEALRVTIASMMTRLGLERERALLATASFAASQDELKITADPADLPDEYVRVVREANKPLIREHLEHGVILDWATLVPQPPTLRLRKHYRPEQIEEIVTS